MKKSGRGQIVAIHQVLRSKLAEYSAEVGLSRSTTTEWSSSNGQKHTHTQQENHYLGRATSATLQGII